MSSCVGVRLCLVVFGVYMVVFLLLPSKWAVCALCSYGALLLFYMWVYKDTWVVVYVIRIL